MNTKNESRKLGSILEEMKAEVSSKLDKETLLDWFLKNPNPPDTKVHALADEFSIEHSKVEEMIYSLVTDYAKSKKAQ
jgi:hypothetical protein